MIFTIMIVMILARIMLVDHDNHYQDSDAIGEKTFGSYSGFLLMIKSYNFVIINYDLYDDDDHFNDDGH